MYHLSSSLENDSLQGQLDDLLLPLGLAGRAKRVAASLQSTLSYKVGLP